MILLLHEKISQIVPIHGISSNEDGSYRIDYINEPTEEQILAVQAIIDNFPLLQAKQEKLKIIDLEWQNVEKIGWDSGLGYYLGITPNDVALLSGGYALAKEADALGLALPKFIAMDNSTISFNNLSEMTQLLLRYGDARATLASSFADRRKAIDNANSIEELNSI